MDQSTKLCSKEQKLRFEKQLHDLLHDEYKVSMKNRHPSYALEFIAGLPVYDRRNFWDRMAERTGGSRVKIYKFYNNSYKAFVMEKFSNEDLNRFAKTAQEIVFRHLAGGWDECESKLVIQSIEEAKAALDFQQYTQEYSPNAAYHKMRNAILRVIAKWQDPRESREKLEMEVFGAGSEESMTSPSANEQSSDKVINNSQEMLEMLLTSSADDTGKSLSIRTIPVMTFPSEPPRQFVLPPFMSRPLNENIESYNDSMYFSCKESPFSPCISKENTFSISERKTMNFGTTE